MSTDKSIGGSESIEGLFGKRKELIKLLGLEINPKCSMYEIEEQFKKYGVRDDCVSGNPFCSFLRFKRGDKTIYVRGKKDGSSVWEIEEHYHYKHEGLVRKSLWTKHWWTRFDR